MNKVNTKKLSILHFNSDTKFGLWIYKTDDNISEMLNKKYWHEVQLFVENDIIILERSDKSIQILKAKKVRDNLEEGNVEKIENLFYTTA